ncbi:unnamed protein product, partial [Mesorhabditis belari]|uniref:Uncharacterized protein n=1 Tax=Mesorhabditis belari TaxID=2138241 RepID=A0AAF3FRS5_9BILA
MNMMVMPFITEDPEFLCEIPKGNKTLYEPFDKCTMKDLNDWHIQCEAIPNSKYVYNTTIHESIASEFDLVCNDYESTEHASSIFLFGGMIASPVITQLSDMMGRKAINAFSGVVSFLGDIGSVIAPYLKRLEAVHASAPNLLIAVTSFIAAFCILFLPETKDKKLPEDLDAFDPGPLGRFLEKREKEKTKKTKSNGKDIEAPMLEAIPEESSSQENTN